MKKEGEPTKNTYDMLEMDTFFPKKHQKTKGFWVVSEADLRFQAAKSNTKAILKYLADQKKHLTWNPVYFCAELTTSLSRDRNQRFLRSS